MTLTISDFVKAIHKISDRIIYVDDRATNPLPNGKTLLVLQVTIDGDLDDESTYPPDLNINLFDGIGTGDQIR